VAQGEFIYTPTISLAQSRSSGHAVEGLTSKLSSASRVLSVSHPRRSGILRQFTCVIRSFEL